MADIGVHSKCEFDERGRAAAAALLCAVVVFLGGCGGDDEKAAENRPFTPATTPAPTATLPAGTVTTASGEARPATFRGARKAVDNDRYDVAERTFSSLRPAQRKVLGERIANRLARRARAALRVGNRSRVQSLLAQADRYPKTRLTRRVRAEYRATEARVAARNRQRLLDRQQLIRDRIAKRKAARAAEAARRAQQQRTTP